MTDSGKSRTGTATSGTSAGPGTSAGAWWSISGKGPTNRRKRILMASVHVVSWLPADTELEALLLEDGRIKRM